MDSSRCCLLRVLRRRHPYNIVDGFLLITSFHCSLSFTFFTFLINWPLSPAGFCMYWCWSRFLCSGLTYEIYGGGGPSMYLYSVVYHVIAAPYVGSFGCLFAHLYSCWWFEMPLVYELSLWPNVLSSGQDTWLSLVLVNSCEVSSDSHGILTQIAGHYILVRNSWCFVLHTSPHKLMCCYVDDGCFPPCSFLLLAGIPL